MIFVEMEISLSKYNFETFHRKTGSIRPIERRHSDHCTLIQKGRIGVVNKLWCVRSLLALTLTGTSQVLLLSSRNHRIIETILSTTCRQVGIASLSPIDGSVSCTASYSEIHTEWLTTRIGVESMPTEKASNE